MNYVVYACACQRGVNNACQIVNAQAEQLLQISADYAERQEKHQAHNQNEHRHGGVFAGQDFVDFLRTQAFPAHARLGHSRGAYPLDKPEAHIRNRRRAVKSAFLFHLQNNVLYHFKLVLLELKRLNNQPVAFNHLARGKALGDTCLLRVVLNQVAYSVQAAVNRAAVMG